MASIALPVDTDRATGSSVSRRLRAEGKVPAVLYGHGGAPQSLAIDIRALRSALSSEAGTGAILELQIGGDRQLALVKDLQLHPVRHTVVHVDLLRLSAAEAVSAAAAAAEAQVAAAEAEQAREAEIAAEIAAAQAADAAHAEDDAADPSVETAPAV
jgi:large subunit ribosomal protein L25